MHKSLVICYYTLKSLLRKNLIVAFLLLEIFITIGLLSLESYSISLQAKFIKNVSYNIQQILGAFLVLLLTIEVIYSDLENKLAYFYFTKALSIHSYVLGKFAALVLCIFLFGIINFLNFFVILLLREKIFFYELLFGCITVMLWQIVYCSILFFFTITLSKIVSYSLSILILLICFGTDLIEMILSMDNFGTISSIFIFALYLFIPDFNLYNAYYSVVHEFPFDYKYLIFLIYYTLAFSLLYLTMTINVLNRKEL